MAQRLFSLEGREAPALHLIGLVGSLLGASLSVAGVAGGGPILFIVGVTLLTLGLTSLAGASSLLRVQILSLLIAGPVTDKVFSGTTALTCLTNLFDL